MEAPLTGTLPPVGKLKGEVRIGYAWTLGAVLKGFFEGLRRGEILGARCPECRRVLCPPFPVCGPCWRRVEERLVPVGPRATVETFTVVSIAYPGQLLAPPYAVGVLKVDGTNTRFQHLVGGAGVAALAIGDRVRPVWRAEGEREGSFFDIRYFERANDKEEVAS